MKAAVVSLVCLFAKYHRSIESLFLRKISLSLNMGTLSKYLHYKPRSQSALRVRKIKLQTSENYSPTNTYVNKNRKTLFSSLYAISIIAALLIAISFVLPSSIMAWPEKFKWCDQGSCHITVDTDVGHYTGRDGVEIDNDTNTGSMFISKDLPSAASNTFELDWYATNMTNSASFGTGLALAVPNQPSSWTVGAGTSADPGWAGWKDAWDLTDGFSWSAVTDDPTNMDAYTITFDDTSWEGHRNRGSADDTGVGGSPGDTDLTNEAMGTDATVTIPTAASGTYTIYAQNTGHEGSTRTYKRTTITCNIVNITNLAADQASYGQGETITVDFTGDNTSSNNLTGSDIYYLIFIDEDADGTPDTNEEYIKTDGTSGGDWTSGDITTDYTNKEAAFAVNSSSTNTDQWTISNSNFPQNTGYTVYAEWAESNTAIIDTANDAFNSVNALTWSLLFLAVLLFLFLAVRKGDLKLRFAAVMTVLLILSISPSLNKNTASSKLFINKDNTKIVKPVLQKTDDVKKIVSSLNNISITPKRGVK